VLRSYRSQGPAGPDCVCVLLLGNPNPNYHVSPAAAGLEEAGRVRRGDTVLVTAAAGGTGQFAVQLAAAAGATVVATCGGPAKAALLRRLGAARVIDYHQERVKDVLKREFPKARLCCPACGCHSYPV